jgi:hypothetical protein
MIRIAITAEASEAIASMLPGSLGYEPGTDDKGDTALSRARSSVR